MESKGSDGWVGEGEVRGERGARMGYCSAPGLPGLWAEGRGMIFSHCLGKKFFFFWRALFCVSLHRCGDAPIPAVLVSSPLPFDDQHTLSHGFMETHTDTLAETVKKVSRIALVSAFL